MRHRTVLQPLSYHEGSQFSINSGLCKHAELPAESVEYFESVEYTKLLSCCWGVEMNLSWHKFTLQPRQDNSMFSYDLDDTQQASYHSAVIINIEPNSQPKAACIQSLCKAPTTPYMCKCAVFSQTTHLCPQMGKPSLQGCCCCSLQAHSCQLQRLWSKIITQPSTMYSGHQCSLHSTHMWVCCLSKSTHRI